jgi:hypothetical protein
VSSSLVDAESTITITLSRMRKICRRRRVTRPLADKNSFGNPGNGMQFSWRRGADPPKNESMPRLFPITNPEQDLAYAIVMLEQGSRHHREAADSGDVVTGEQGFSIFDTLAPVYAIPLVRRCLDVPPNTNKKSPAGTSSGSMSMVTRPISH